MTFLQSFLFWLAKEVAEFLFAIGIITSAVILILFVSLLTSKKNQK
jgi:multisubunit Na+/H+ antiporter MnhE subunit